MPGQTVHREGAFDPDFDENGYVFLGHCTDDRHSAIGRVTLPVAAHEVDYAAVASSSTDVLVLHCPETDADEHATGYAALSHPDLGDAFQVEARDRRAHFHRTEVSAMKPTLTILEPTTETPFVHLVAIDALPRVKAASPATRVVFLTMHNDASYARRALEAGASGYVLKHSAPEELILAVRSALQDRTFITPALAGQVLASMKRAPASADPVAALSPRQREILRLLATGMSAKQIAGVLDISHRTVEFHKYQAMDALALKSNAELIHFAIKHGLVA